MSSSRVITRCILPASLSYIRVPNTDRTELKWRQIRLQCFLIIWRNSAKIIENLHHRPIPIFLPRSQYLCVADAFVSVFIHFHYPKFIIYFLARSANLPEGLYILPSVSFFFYIIFFNDFSETNYLKIHRTDFRNLYIEWMHFGRR